MPKSTVSYVAVNNPFSLKIPVVQKREQKTYRNWKNKAELLEYIESLPVPDDMSVCMSVKCHCGIEHKFLSKEDIPDKDFCCSCGRNIIEYETK